MSLTRIKTVRFPTPRNSVINMMPIVMGDAKSLPAFLEAYQNIINACDLPRNYVVYLTVHESWVHAGTTQRRAGIHTDATSAGPWGGGNWGDKGIYIASTDGGTRVWEEETWDVDEHGAVQRYPCSEARCTRPHMLYRITDRTPHEALPALFSHYRQFFRLVGPDIHAWYAKHSTPNPNGLQPGCPVSYVDKFEART